VGWGNWARAGCFGRADQVGIPSRYDDRSSVKNGALVEARSIPEMLLKIGRTLGRLAKAQERLTGELVVGQNGAPVEAPPSRSDEVAGEWRISAEAPSPLPAALMLPAFTSETPRYQETI
jgi:hypothetical protein